MSIKRLPTIIYSLTTMEHLQANYNMTNSFRIRFILWLLTPDGDHPCHGWWMVSRCCNWGPHTSIETNSMMLSLATNQKHMKVSIFILGNTKAQCIIFYEWHISQAKMRKLYDHSDTISYNVCHLGLLLNLTSFNSIIMDY